MDDSCDSRHRRVVPVDLRSAMIRTACDQCDHAIGRVEGNWFGVDWVRLDDDGELIEPGVDHKYHFCSFDCLASWAMHRAFTQPPTEATT